MTRTLPILLLTASMFGWSASGTLGQTDENHAEQMAAGLRLFKSNVRTIFQGRCIKCHHPAESQGGLDLSTRKSLLAGGDSGPAIEIGKPEQSYLVQLIRHAKEPAMPEDGARLDDRQIELVMQWVALGAPYDKPLKESSDSEPEAWIRKLIDVEDRQFWSFQPLVEIPIPQLENDEWSRNEIDRFVRQRLATVGILPNPLASRRQLIRRAYFDLIGLPPTPAQISAFITDESPQAYANMVDQLLASPHYGERWARHWLDVVRYAESHGFEQDYDRPHAYHYRDFVIKALNADMPFDRFVRWQVAGDEIAPNDPLAMMATGFMGAGVFPTQLTEKEFESARYDELDDIVSTTGTAFLGLTIGCARCHDHKFDPIPMRDYYQMVSVFRNTIRSNVEIELNPELTQSKLAQWDQEHQQLVRQLMDYERHELPGKFQQRLDDNRATAGGKQLNDDSELHAGSIDASQWIAIHPASVASEQGTTLTVDSEAKIHASGSNPASDSYTITLETNLTEIRSLRLEAFPDESLKRNGPGRADNGNFALSKLTVTAQPLDQPSETDSTTDLVPIKLKHPRATFQQNENNLSIKASLDNNPKTGWAVDPKFGQFHAAAFDFEQPVGFPAGTRLKVKLDFAVNTRHSIGVSRFSISQSASPLALDEEGVLAFDAEWSAATGDNQRLNSPSVQEILANAFKYQDETWRVLSNQVHDHTLAKPKPQTITAMICSEGVKPIPHHGDGRGFPHFYPTAHFLHRGDVNQKIAVADPGYLQVLSPVSLIKNATNSSLEPETDGPDSVDISQGDNALDWSNWQTVKPDQAKTSYRRQALANWLTDDQNGAGRLLARVIVNRLWQHHFGRGLVATPNDFGFQGSRPTHPALLDFLAGRLIEENWQLKPIHRLMMVCATYRQSSDYDLDREKSDPENNLLWRFNPRRMEAEIIRDSMLYCSGQLDPTPYGPGTLDESMQRRSIYFQIKRSKLIPFLQIFDSPEPLVSVGRRPATTVAPQALLCMNNPQVRKWAVSFANRLQEAEKHTEKQVIHGYVTTLAREPDGRELRGSTAFIESQIGSYLQEGNRSPADAKTLALADLCQVLMSLNEFVYIN